MSGLGGAALAGTALAVEVGAVAWAGRRLAEWIDPDGDAWDRALAGVVAALALVVVVPTALGAAGVLHRATVAVGIVAASAAVILTTGVRQATRPRAPGHTGRWLSVATAVVAAAAAGHALAVGLAGRSSDPDTRHYGVPNLAWWLADGSLWRLPFATPGYVTHVYPSAFELSGALLVAPTGDDRLLYVAVLPWLALAVLAAAVVGRELGADPRAGALCGLALITTPLVVWTQTAALKADVAAAAGVVAAAGLVLRRARSSSPARRTEVLAGVALGLSLASKYTAYAPALGVVVLAAIVAPTAVRRRMVGSVVLGAVAIAGFWWVRNLAVTGNPLFPLAVGPLEGADTPLSRYELALVGHVVEGRGEVLRTWSELARTFYGWSLALPAVALAGLLRPGTRRVWLVSGLAAACLVAYVATPYTGGGEEAVTFLIGSQLRYATPALLLAAAVAAAVVGRAAPALAGGVLAWNLWRLAEGIPTVPEVNLRAASAAWTVVLSVASALLLVPDVRRRLATRPQLAAASATVAVAAVATGALVVQDDGAPRPIEQVLTAVGHPHGPVATLYVEDVRDLLGEDFDVELTKVHGGGAADERPILDPGELDRALLAAGAPVVAVDLNTASPTMPAGWAPGADWHLAATQGRTSLFVRAAP